ncbi:MAG: diacylglycerol kinase family protein [Pseudomonadota bacterium]
MTTASAAPLSISPTAPLFIVHNAASGSQDTDATRQTIAEVLNAAGRTHHLRAVESGAQFQATVRRAVADAKASGGVVVAAGGDGTINAVAAATLGSGCPFGVLPQGTFNYFSRTHGIPLDAAEATQQLLSPQAWPVQVGLVNERVFLVNASLGLYPQLLEDREAYKSQFGRNRLVALGAGLVTLLREHRQLRLRIEQADCTRMQRTPTLFVGNNALQLAQIGMPEAPLLEQGLLAAIVLKPVGTLAMLGLLARGALGRLGEDDSVESFAFRSITVTPALPYGTRRVKIATDGEICWLKAPLVFRVAPEPLYLLKPAPQ